MLSADCGGFQYVDSSKRCYYRKDASCAQKVSADRDCFVKAKQQKTCEEWAVYPNLFARMFAMKGQVDLEGAKAKCTERPNCRAVTCNKHGKCTLRKGSLVRSTVGEISYVPNTACQAGDTSIDCKELPASPSGDRFGRGCSGAKLPTGEWSQQTCTNAANAPGAEQKWFQHCCIWTASMCKSKAGTPRFHMYDNRLLQNCIGSKTIANNAYASFGCQFFFLYQPYPKCSWEPTRFSGPCANPDNYFLLTDGINAHHDLNACEKKCRDGEYGEENQALCFTGCTKASELLASSQPASYKVIKAPVIKGCWEKQDGYVWVPEKKEGCWHRNFNAMQKLPLLLESDIEIRLKCTETGITM